MGYTGFSAEEILRALRRGGGSVGMGASFVGVQMRRTLHQTRLANFLIPCNELLSERFPFRHLNPADLR